MSFGAMRKPFTCADVLACLEREFSDWSIYDSFADADHSGDPWYDAAVVNAEETKIIISSNVGSNLSVLKVYDIASKVLSAALIEKIFTIGAAVPPIVNSALGTYIAVAWATTTPGDLNRVSIIKDGVVLKTLTEADLGILEGGYIKGVFVSASGKYIIVSGYLPAPIDSWGWVILVGS